jgi:hypothetical protein
MPTPLRAASLAAWGTAFLNGSVPLEAAVRAIEDDDEPHLVVLGALGSPDELADALTRLRTEGVVALRLCLPAPGDPLGLVGPPTLNHHVLAAGEAAIAVDPRVGSDATVAAFVPDISAFGTPDDQGNCVTWRMWPSSAAQPDVPGVAQADRELTDAVREATAVLSGALLGSWSSDAANVAERLRGSNRTLLPDVAGARAESLAQRAVQVAAIVEAARADDGGAVTAHSAAVRAASLAPLDRAARRALVAAVAASCRDAVLR